MLSEVLPKLAAALLAISAIIAILMRRLRRTYAGLRASEAQSQHLAFHDVLTGLPNRVQFNDALDNALAKTRAQAGKLALLFLDLDRFNQVNDTFGHPAGDEVIREVAARLSAWLAPGDFLARTGGDEFAIIKADPGSAEAIAAFCQGLLLRVSNPFDVLGNQTEVSFSIGVARAPADGVDRTELARKADIALYRAKNNGRHDFAIFTEEMTEAVQNRQILERELRRALDTRGELELAYQPIYSAVSGSISGVEALARWKHPRLGPLAPAAFIPIAEEGGLIDRLGAWVLTEAAPRRETGRSAGWR